MVTGKNKEQFKEWYWNDFARRKENIGLNIFGIKQFYKSPFEMQIGVYLAYYDSKGIFVDSEKSYDLVIEDLTDEFESGFWYKKDYRSTKGYFNSRNEAYKEAFKEMDKLMNEELTIKK